VGAWFDWILVGFSARFRFANPKDFENPELSGCIGEGNEYTQFEEEQFCKPVFSLRHWFAG